MKKEELIKLINEGREIEFTYNSNRFSITYYGDYRFNYISVCAYNGEPIDVSNAEEAINLLISGKRIYEIFELLDDKFIDIY